jgi:hypothetical protein
MRENAAEAVIGLLPKAPRTRNQFSAANHGLESLGLGAASVLRRQLGDSLHRSGFAVGDRT